jgi:hypothetical protein
LWDFFLISELFGRYFCKALVICNKNKEKLLSIQGGTKCLIGFSRYDEVHPQSFGQLPVGEQYFSIFASLSQGISPYKITPDIP